MKAANLVGTAVLLALTACAPLPPRGQMPQMHPADHYETNKTFSAPAGEWPQDSWWQSYADTQLNELIDTALHDSPTMAVAAARLQRAEASTRIARASNRPQLNANATVTEQKQSYNYVSPRSVTPQNWNDYGRATLDFSWELDFWGKNRAAIAAATSEADAARADAAQARLVLTTSIASSYAELARLFAALDTANAAYEIRKQTAELFRHRYDNGLEVIGNVRQVEARLATAQADVLSLQEQLMLTQQQLAALVGAGPDRALAITRPTINLARSFALPGNLAADLLGRRPDIAAARMRAQAAAKRIDQAQAAFYPNINLAAFIGVQSLGLDLLAKEDSSIGSVGPAISLPIFSGGRLRGQLSAARAEYAEAVANYESTVIKALQDVASAATSQRALGEQLARTTEAVTAAREAWQIQNNRYDGGLATYLDVLSAEDYLLTNERAQSDLESRAFALDIALTRALGGGFSLLSG